MYVNVVLASDDNKKYEYMNVVITDVLIYMNVILAYAPDDDKKY